MIEKYIYIKNEIKLLPSCMVYYRSFYDHPTYFIVVNLGTEIETVNLLKFRDTLPIIMKVKISSINSGFITGYVDTSYQIYTSKQNII